MKRNSALLAALLSLTLVTVFGCTKGMGVGGTEDSPAAVETAGVSEIPHHGAAAGGEHGEAKADHEGPTSPADAHGRPTEPGTATSQQAVPTTPPVRPADAAPTTGQSAASGVQH